MELTDFTDHKPGRLLALPEGTWAFVPDPLPPRLELGLGTVRLLDEASHALGELAGVGRMLPNPHLLIGPFLRREAILSSQIEGTIASMDELLLFEAAPSRKTGDVQEVANYVSTMEYGIKRLNELSMCTQLIRELHERLLGGVRGAKLRPGEFRQLQNFIAQRGQPITEARFIPPPVPEMMQALHDFDRFLKDPCDLPSLVQLALVHYQFEVIHPFMDGNGRLGRLLVALQLCERNLLPAPLLYLSAYFERNRAEYMDRLLQVSQEGTWTEWIEFFLRGVAEQSRDAVRRSKRMLDLWEQYRHRLQTARGSALLLRLVDELFAAPVTTVAMAQRCLGVTPRSAQLNIAKLEELEILSEMTGRTRGRVYIAQGIVEVSTALDM